MPTPRSWLCTITLASLAALAAPAAADPVISVHPADWVLDAVAEGQ
jgi:hypothetical protein